MARILDGFLTRARDEATVMLFEAEVVEVRMYLQSRAVSS